MPIVAMVETTGPGPSNGTRYTVMEAADPEEMQPFTSDFLHLKRTASKDLATMPWHERLLADRRALLRSSIGGAGLLLLALLIVAVVIVAFLRSTMLAVPQATGTFNSWCITPLGGGMVGSGGNFGHYNSSACVRQLQLYFVPGGAYTREVELVGTVASSYFMSRPPADPTQLVVFDIDETVLSNIDSFFTEDGAHINHKDQHDDGKAAAALPAIKPILQIYDSLYRQNYSVAFVTGRSEPMRSATAANLAAAGFGGPCPAGGGHRRSRHLAGAGSGPLRGAVPPAESAADRPAKPCYSALMLRTKGDVRYASVYKPEARGALKAMGYEVVGNFGDQFSDLVGLNAATPGSFKMPNPVYYIL